MSLSGSGLSHRRQGLKAWQQQQKAAKKKWKQSSSQYTELARKLHKMFQTYALGTPSGHKDGHLNSFYSIESSTFWPHLLKTAEVITLNGFDPKKYMQAQFEFFRNYFNKIPYPTQLHTPNAVDRYVQFVANQQLRIEEKSLREATLPKQSPKVRERERLLYWQSRIAMLARPRGASDKEAVMLHCEKIPMDILVEYGVWEKVRERWERANSR